jgi:hypothetical protein
VQTHRTISSRSFVARRLRLSLLAVLLLFAQVLLVSHASHDQLPDDERSTCVVCVLGHALGGAVGSARPILPMPVSGLPDTVTAEPAFLAVPVAAYLARGPPSRG